MTDLPDLLARLEKATDGSRELDTELLRMAGHRVAHRGKTLGWEMWLESPPMWGSMSEPTSSIDAAVALCRRVTDPINPLGFGLTWTCEGVTADIAWPFRKVEGKAPFDQPALALCIAVVSAKLQLEMHDD